MVCDMFKRDELKISVIMPSFNAKKTIEQAISSVVNQTYNNVELIIIDGGSQDGTVDILKKYEDKIAYWVSEPDNGIYNAANKALDHATGDYVLWLSADDCLVDELVVAKAVDLIEPDTGILSGNIIMVQEDNMLESVYSNDFARDKAKYSGGMIPAEAMFVRKDICDKYRFDESYVIAGDYKRFLQCYYDDTVKFKFVDLFVTYFSDGGISSTSADDCRQEDNRIYRELGLLNFVDRHLKANSPWYVVCLKTVLKKVGLFSGVKYLYNVVITGKQKRHHCNNRICRWCGRNVQ